MKRRMPNRVSSKRLPSRHGKFDQFRKQNGLSKMSDSLLCGKWRIFQLIIEIRKNKNILSFQIVLRSKVLQIKKKPFLEKVGLISFHTVFVNKIFVYCFLKVAA